MVLAIRAYEQRERAAYWRSGLITSAIVNQHRGRGQRAATPEDFMPQQKPVQPQSPSMMAEIMKAATIAMGGEVLTSVC